LADNSKVDLRSGDALVLLGPSSTRQLRGPGSFVVGSQQALAMNSRTRFGAQRSVFLRPTPWEVDVTKSGSVCVANPSDLALWRLDAAEPVTLRIERSGEEAAVLNWPANEARLSWPENLPIEDGIEYRLHRGDKQTAVTIRTLAAKPDDQVSTAQAMIEKNCVAQLEALVRSSPLEE
jgi:hypothetical protein